jgi:glycosyltransferase 2 family protein
VRPYSYQAMRFYNVKGRGQIAREVGTNRHQRISVAIKLVVTTALISYVLRVANISEIRRVIGTAHWVWLALAVVAFAGTQTLCALRWALVSQPLQLNRSWHEFLRLYFLGAFFNTFLPTTIGGDVVKAYYLTRDTHQLARSTTSVFMDRNVGLGSLLIVGCVAATMNGATLRGMSIVPVLWLLFAGYCVSNAALLYHRLHEMGRRKLRQLWFEGLDRRLGAMFGSLAIYRKNLVTMTVTVVFSVGIQLVNFLAVFFIGLAIGASAALKHYLVFLPVITVMTMLPVSIGGLGVRESALVTFFIPVGLTPEQSVTLGLLWHAVTVIASLPGGWIYLTYRRNQSMPELAEALLAADES